MAFEFPPGRDTMVPAGRSIALLQRIARILAVAAVLGALAASLLALGAAHYWLADLAVHFRLQYAVLGALALLFHGWRRHWPLAAAAGLVIAINAPPVIAQFLPEENGALRTALAAAPVTPTPRTTLAAASATPTPRTMLAAAPAAPTPRTTLAAASVTPMLLPGPQRLAPRASVAAAPPAVAMRLAAVNVFFFNEAHDQMIAWVRRARPEVVVFIEASPAWQQALRVLDADYPHRTAVTDGPRDGLLVLSRWPLRDPRLAPDRRDILFVTVDKQGHALRLAAVHASWPLLPRHQLLRAADFAAVAAEARAAARAGLPYAALGDYNVSPFSPHFTRLLEAGNLRSASASRGWQPTWPTFLPLLGIQIDYALVTPDVRVTGFERGAGTGSDHRPIVVDVTIPAAAG